MDLVTSDVKKSCDDTGQFLTGLIGNGILASRSPWLHEQEAASQGMELAYSLFDFAERGWGVDRLSSLLKTLIQDGFSGVNVTYPFKQAILPLLDELSDEATAIGAVNTVAFRDGRSFGHNTDLLGFSEGMKRGLPDARLDRVLQLGCGGAGAAVAHALLSRSKVGVLFLHDIDAERGGQLSRVLAQCYGADRVVQTTMPAEEAADCDGLVNATPMGMAKYPGTPIPVNSIESRHWVCDIVYFPIETEFLRQAGRKGCATLDGSGMVIHQAAAAFGIMTGQPADAERMAASFGKAPSGCSKSAG